MMSDKHHLLPIIRCAGYLELSRPVELVQQSHKVTLIVGPRRIHQRIKENSVIQGINSGASWGRQATIQVASGEHQKQDGGQRCWQHNHDIYTRNRNRNRFQTLVVGGRWQSRSYSKLDTWQLGFWSSLFSILSVCHSTAIDWIFPSTFP